MSNYKSYPNSVDTPSRKTRKSTRNTVFIFNSKIKRLADRAKRAERQANG